MLEHSSNTPVLNTKKHATQNFNYFLLQSKKCKVFPVHIMKTWRGSKNSFLLNLGTEWRWAVSFAFLLLDPWREIAHAYWTGGLLRHIGGLGTVKQRVRMLLWFGKWRWCVTLMMFKWYSATSEEQGNPWPQQTIEPRLQMVLPAFFFRQRFGLLVYSDRQ
jgi:hypothetical protein